MYESPKLKKHGAAVCKYVDNALIDYQGSEDSLIKLGGRHVTRGISAAHYDIVGQAFLKTLGDALGADFTPELK